jgi:outer membrane protein with beta-barrel domain
MSPIQLCIPHWIRSFPKYPCFVGKTTSSFSSASKSCVREYLFALGLVLLHNCQAPAERIPFAGVLGGVATLSADAASQSTPGGLNLSSYSPSNGGALDVFAGVHFHNYFSVEADYVWNQNDLVLNSSSSTSGNFYQQERSSSQNAGVVSLLIYFRPLKSRVRPYLGTGIGVVHLSSTARRLISAGGTPQVPPATFDSNSLVLRSHVGIDFKLKRAFSFRYTFSETIGHNETSRQLSPPGTRRLANFQNLFGFVAQF